jgi:hypothetical protein
MATKPKPGGLTTSPRPKARPPLSRPKARPDDLMASETLKAAERASKRQAQDEDDFVQKKARGGKVTKMKSGGMCRGMGAASRGGRYGKSA